MTESHRACKEGNLQDLKAALLPSDEPDSAEPALSTDLRSRNFPYENTPLHLAALFGHEDIVIHLAENIQQCFNVCFH